MLTVIVAILLFSTLAASVSFHNFWYINVSAYLELAFGICFGVILIIILIKLRKSNSVQFAFNMPDLLVLIWAAYYLISYILSNRYNFLISYALVMCIAFSTYFFVRRIVKFKSRKSVKNIFYVVLFIGTLEAIYGILQLSNILPNIFQFKFGGSYGNPGDLANLLTVSYIVSLGLYFHFKEKKYRYFILVAAIIQLSFISNM